MLLQAGGDPVDACLELELWKPLDHGAEELLRPEARVHALDFAGDQFDLFAGEELVLEGDPLWCHH